MGQYILAIAQGTSGTKSIIFTATGELVTKATTPLKSSFPQVGFAEQDPLEVYQSVLFSVNACVQQFTIDPAHDLNEIVTCGISNQRETFLLWDEAGTPLCNAIV